MHSQAHLAAEAAQCANAENKFWEYHDQLFANQRALQKNDLEKYAAAVGLDQEAFNACLESGRTAADVDADHTAGVGAGVSGTPAFFINGRFLSGAQPFDKFKKVIDEELEDQR
jgi:protein-disulfide isomerase